MHRIFKIAKTLTGNRDIFPFYHLVSNDTPAHIKQLYQTRSIRQFESDLEFLLTYYTPSSFEDWVDQKPESKPKMILSFDDGLREVGEIVAPILKRKGIPSMLFVNSAFVGNHGLFYRYKVSLVINALIATGQIPDHVQMLLDTSIFDETADRLSSFSIHDENRIDQLAEVLNVDFDNFLKEDQPYLTINEILSLQTDYDFTIGAHSINHPRFSDISEEEQYRQIMESTAFVKQHFASKLTLFAFPFTDFGVRDELIDQLKTDDIIDYTFGTAGIKNEPILHHIQRIPMEASTLNAHLTLRKEMLGFLGKGLVGKRKVRRV